MNPRTDTIATLARTRPNGWVEPGPPTYGARLVAVHRDPAPPLWLEAVGALVDAGRIRDAEEVARTEIGERVARAAWAMVETVDAISPDDYPWHPSRGPQEADRA